ETAKPPRDQIAVSRCSGRLVAFSVSVDFDDDQRIGPEVILRQLHAWRLLPVRLSLPMARRWARNVVAVARPGKMLGAHAELMRQLRHGFCPDQFEQPP